MTTVQLRDQGEDVKRLVEDAERGGIVSVVRDGREVVRIVPSAVEPEKRTQEEHDAGLKRLIAMMDEGCDMGGVWNGRDELYDRD